MSKWCRTPPFRKQKSFLDSNELEVLFGGAAGGGKSESLLRAALQYAHVPGYSALILRTRLTDLTLPGGLIPRSHAWLADTAADWNGNTYRWTFPSGATLQYGYLASQFDKFRYGSSEFQFIAFDELTEFSEDDYTFMFSRLRKTVAIPVPYRMRSASNPGGRGHEWVKARFVSDTAITDLKNNTLKDRYTTKSADGHVRVFIPAKIRDNPAVNPEDYIKNLMHLNPVERERLLNGDWTIMPTGLIKAKWLRYFKMRDRVVDLLLSRSDPDSNIIHTNETLYSYHEAEANRIMVIDSAGGVEDIERELQGKPLSYTAAGIFDQKTYGANQRALLVRYVKRGRGLSYTDIKELVKLVYYMWKPSRIYVEDKAMGMALYSDLRGQIPITPISPGTKDKVARAALFTNMMEEGQVYLPQGENSWLPAYESELLGWQGRKEGKEVNDQIDISAYAAIVASEAFGGTIKLDIDPRLSAVELVREPIPMAGGGLMKGWQ